MDKIVYVKAPFKPISFTEKTVKVPTGETKKDFFGREKPIYRTEKERVPKKYSLNEIDGEGLAKAIEWEIARLEAEGHRIVSITPITSGGSATKEGWPIGASYTDGVMILARPKELSELFVSPAVDEMV